MYDLNQGIQKTCRYDLILTNALNVRLECVLKALTGDAAEKIYLALLGRDYYLVTSGFSFVG
jgi:hypothetical protein